MKPGNATTIGKSDRPARHIDLETSPEIPTVNAMPDFNPATIIVAELLRKLEAVPFVPFTIVMSNGVRYDVPRADHITITRRLRRIELETDEPRIVDINALHVASLETLKPAA